MRKNLEDWLPLTSSRNAKHWWYAAAHNVTAIVGLGVLALPAAMAKLGWGPGLVVLGISYIISPYTLWQMAQMQEMVSGKRFDRYHELGQYAFGDKLGLWIVVPQQLVVLVGTNIVYVATGGKSLKRFHDIVCSSCSDIMLNYYIMIFASLQFVVAQLPSFNSMSTMSFIAAAMSLAYCTIAWGASVRNKQPDVDYGYKANSTAGTIFDFFTALGTVAFAFAINSVALEIQATIPSTPERPSKKPMLRGVAAAYIVVTLCYFPVAIIGFWAFGNYVDSNILVTLDEPRWLVAAAHMMLVVHLIGGYQIFAMPVLDMMEGVLVEKVKLPSTVALRVVCRVWYVAFTMFISIAFPFFNGLLSFLGGFGLASTTYVIPCIMWLTVFKPRRFSLLWITNWICILLGGVLMTVTAIGSLRQLVVKNFYEFYS